MPNDTCCVQGCPSSTVLHHFPDDPERVAEWRQRLEVADDSRRLAACERHFSEGQYAGFGRSRSLKPNAVPDSNLPKVKLEAESASSLNSGLEVTPEVIVGDHRFKGDEGSFATPPVALENLNRLCRLCLETDKEGTHLSLFGTEGIVDSIQQSIGIALDPDDPFPKQICPVCVERVNYIQRSREWFQKNDHLLKTLVPEVGAVVSNEDLIIPDVVPATEAIFFKEEFGNARAEIDEDGGGIAPKKPCPTKSKARKKRASSRRPNSFCTLCNREFDSPRDLRNHLNSIHQGICCKKCGMVFSHTGTLKMHIELHHRKPNRLEPRLESKNLFQEMAEKFNEGVVVPLTGEGSSASGERVAAWSESRPKRQKTMAKQ